MFWKSIAVSRGLITLSLLLSTLWSAHAIVGGRFENPSSYPYLIQLPRCAGVKIGPRHILTAAHCIEFQPREGVIYQAKIEAGLVNQSGQIHHENLTIRNSFIHPDFFGAFQSVGSHRVNQGPDIGIFEIEPSSRFQSLPTAGLFRGDSLSINELLILGWGDQVDGLVSDTYRNTILALHRKNPELEDKLKSAIAYPNQVSENFISIYDTTPDGKPARGASGDSGGPALFFDKELNDYVVAGIASFRSLGGGNMRYTKVSAAIDWISDVLNGLEEPTPIIDQSIGNIRIVEDEAWLLHSLFPESQKTKGAKLNCRFSRNFESSGELASHISVCTLTQGSGLRILDLENQWELSLRLERIFRSLSPKTQLPARHVEILVQIKCKLTESQQSECIAIPDKNFDHWRRRSKKAFPNHLFQSL